MLPLERCNRLSPYASAETSVMKPRSCCNGVQDCLPFGLHGLKLPLNEILRDIQRAGCKTIICTSSSVMK